MKRKILIISLLLVLLTGCMNNSNNNNTNTNNNNSNNNDNDITDNNVVILGDLKLTNNVVASKIECDYKPKLIFENDERRIFSYCVTNVKVNGELLKEENLNEFLNELDNIDEANVGTYKEGGTKIYKGKSMNVLKCNAILDFAFTNIDIYIGDSSMTYRSNFCKPNNETEVKRFKVEEVKESSIVVSRDNEKDEVYYDHNYKVESGETYDFEFMFNEYLVVEDTIKDIFSSGVIVDVREVK